MTKKTFVLLFVLVVMCAACAFAEPARAVDQPDPEVAVWRLSNTIDDRVNDYMLLTSTDYIDDDLTNLVGDVENDIVCFSSNSSMSDFNITWSNLRDVYTKRYLKSVEYVNQTSRSKAMKEAYFYNRYEQLRWRWTMLVLSMIAFQNHELNELPKCDKSRKKPR